MAAPETTEISQPPPIITSFATQATEQPPITITSAPEEKLVIPSPHGPISETNVHVPPSAESEPESETGAPIANSIPPTPLTDEIPADKVLLTFLLGSGKRKTFPFDSKDTVSKVKSWIFEHWPSEWQDEVPFSVSALKIVHLGRILEDDTTLESNKLPKGQATVVHLVIKYFHGNETNDSKNKDSAPKCKMCIIL